MMWKKNALLVQRDLELKEEKRSYMSVKVSTADV